MANQELLIQEHILTLLREDREQGAELLLETYTPLLWSVCRRRLSDPEDIKECVNDAFASFCMNVHKFDPEQVSLKNYLAMIADRRAISCYRSNQRRNEAESAAAYGENPDQAELYRDLEEALALLQPEDAQIIRMKYYGGMTYREIAGQLGIAEETVKKRGKRSLRKLAKWMIIGLVIAALLAGCTYVVHRYFRYFRGVGVVPDNDLPAYQMVDPPEPISVNGITIHPLNVACFDETVVIALAFLPEETEEPVSRELYLYLANGYGISVNGSAPESPSYSMGIMCRYHITIPRDSLTADENGQMRLRLELIPREETAIEVKQNYGYDMDMSVQGWDITLPETEAIQDLTELGCYLETTYTDFLVLTDWELSAETGDEYTLVSLCPIYKTDDLTLSDLISTCYALLEGREKEYITLSDSAGNVYPVYRTARPTPGQASTEFTLWFKNLPSGEYTLNIPSICYRKEEPTYSVTLALPDQDGETLYCQESLTLQDGSTLSISDVTRQSERSSGFFMTEYWVDDVRTWVREEDDMTIWRYTVSYELTTGDEFPLWGISFSDQFCYETEEGITPCVITLGTYYEPGILEETAFGARDALGMEAPEYLLLTMYEFYYADPYSYSISITIE